MFFLFKRLFRLISGNRPGNCIISSEQDRQRRKKCGHHGEKRQLLPPPVLQQADALAHEGIGPEPPSGAASDALRPEPREGGPDAAPEDVVIGRGVDDPGLVGAGGGALFDQLFEKAIFS